MDRVKIAAITAVAYAGGITLAATVIGMQKYDSVKRAVKRNRVH